MAVLKENGQPGHFEMTFSSKVAAGILSGLILIGATSAAGAFLTVRVLSEKVSRLELSHDGDNAMRDRLSKMEGSLEMLHGAETRLEKRVDSIIRKGAANE